MTPPPAPAPAAGALRVLLVEDEPVTRMAIAECLVESGMAVTEAGDADTVLSLLADMQADMLIVDVNLGGGMTGFDVANLARARWPEVTVIYVTGDLRAVVKTSGQRDLCLLKPFTEAALLQLVRSVSPGRG